MPRYRVIIKEIFKKEMTFNATSKEEAKEKARVRHLNARGTTIEIWKEPQLIIEVEDKKKQSKVR